jgi:hypothetical protein
MFSWFSCYFSFFFFLIIYSLNIFFWWYWGLNSGPHACWAGSLLCQPIISVTIIRFFPCWVEAKVPQDSLVIPSAFSIYTLVCEGIWFQEDCWWGKTANAQVSVLCYRSLIYFSLNTANLLLKSCCLSTNLKIFSLSVKLSTLTFIFHFGHHLFFERQIFTKLRAGRHSAEYMI